MLEGIKKRHHRWMVKGAANWVTHWKREIGFQLFLISLLIIAGTFFVFTGRYSGGLIFIGIGALLYVAYGQKMMKARRMSPLERIQLFAKWNCVNPDEVSAFLAEKQRSVKVS